MEFITRNMAEARGRFGKYSWNAEKTRKIKSENFFFILTHKGALDEYMENKSYEKIVEVKE